MNTTQNIKINPDIIYQEIEGEVVLLNEESEKYFGLDHVGAKFWEIANTTQDVDDIIRQMQNIYDVDSERLAKDINMLIDKMVEHEIVFKSTEE